MYRNSVGLGPPGPTGQEGEGPLSVESKKVLKQQKKKQKGPLSLMSKKGYISLMSKKGPL